MAKKDFNEFRFEGLNYWKKSNKYLCMDRVSDDEKRIVVKVAESHLVRTKYEYALILDATRVIFLKDWEVSENYYGNEVLLNKDYFIVKEWGNHSDFFEDEEATTWEHWLSVAKEQNQKDEEGERVNPVRWEV